MELTCNQLLANKECEIKTENGKGSLLLFQERVVPDG